MVSGGWRASVLAHTARDLWTALRCVGALQTLRIVASSYRDRDFDRTYDTDTAGRANPRIYAAGDPRAARATIYAATRARPFADFLCHAGLSTAGTFVDYGCGKGRAMMVAAQYGFQVVTGVELSPLLCDVARRNVDRFQRYAPGTLFEVICGYASQFAVRDDDSTFYFYDPFDDALIDLCLEQIRRSLARRPRPVAVIYHNSLAARPTPFDRCEFLRETPMPRFSGNAFYLYRNDAASGVAAEPGAPPLDAVLRAFVVAQGVAAAHQLSIAAQTF